MRRSFLSVTLTLCGLYAVCFPGSVSVVAGQTGHEPGVAQKSPTAVNINGEDYDLVSYSCPASAARPLVAPPGCTSTENVERNETEYLCDKPMLAVFADCFVTHAPVGKSRTSSTAAASPSASTPAPSAPPATPAGQVQRVVLGPSSMFPQLASPEMLPALKPGDEVEIAPYAGSPKAGDIVALKHPVDGSTVVARRLVGLPGDEVVVRAGEVLLNGAVIPRMQVGTVGTAASYQETLPNGTQYVVLDDGPNAPFDNAGPLKVPAGHYFVLGDNRDHSLDSRAIFVFGYVPEANIVGRVQIAGAPAPTPPASPSPVAAAPGAEPAPPAEKPGWFSWLWGDSKPEAAPPATPAAQPSPPQPNVTAQSPPPAAPSPYAAPGPTAPRSAQAATSPSQVVSIPPGCPIGQNFGGWTVRRGTLQGVPVVTTGSSATHVGTATKWTSDDLSFEMIPRKDGKWLPMLLVKNLGHAGASVREITGPYAVLVWNAATNTLLGGVTATTCTASLTRSSGWHPT